MSDLLVRTNQVWEQAALGNSSIVVAAFMSNVHLTVFETIDQDLKLLCDGVNPELLRTKVLQSVDNEYTSEVNEAPTSVTLEQRLLDCLQLPYQALLRSKKEYFKEAPEVQPKSSQITVKKGPGSAKMDSECFATLLMNIRRHLQTQERPTSIVLAGTPLFAEVGYYLTHEDVDLDSLRCTFGLDLLLQVYKSYLLAPDRPHAPAECRLQALKFAQEVVSCVVSVLNDPTMPCR